MTRLIMSKKVATTINRPKNSIIGWPDAIQFAEEQIAQAKRRIAVLEGTIYLFRERIACGEPFPNGGSDESIATRR